MQGSQLAASNALARKLAVKLVQRIGLVFLRPRVASWRYQKPRLNMAANLKKAGAAAAAAAAAAAGEGAAAMGEGASAAAVGEGASAGAAAGVVTGETGSSKAAAAQPAAHPSASLPSAAAAAAGAGPGPAAAAEAADVAAAEAAAEAEAGEDVAAAAEQLEGVIEALLVGLADKDTVVRWSAAKGLGRLTMRLPKDLADEVVGSVLEDFFAPSEAACPRCFGMALTWGAWEVVLFQNGTDLGDVRWRGLLSGGWWPLMCLAPANQSLPCCWPQVGCFRCWW